MSISKKIFIILILILSIIALYFLRPIEIISLNTETILAFGFILLTAFAIGELTAYLGFTKVTGYLLTGIIFGPFSKFIFTTDVLNVFSDAAISELNVIYNLSLSLIAFTIGGRINLSDLQNQKKTISLIILFKVIFITIGILLLFLFAYPYLEFLKTLNLQTLIIVALLVSVLLFGSSSIITFAVMNETEDKSKLSKIVLNTSVVKDLLIVFLVVIVISISNFFTIKNNEILNFEFFISGLQNFTLSIVVGIISGLILISYVKYIGKENFIFLILLIFLLHKINLLLNLNYLIVFLLAGFVYNNFSKIEDELIPSIEKVALLLFITIFTITGAELNIKFLLIYLQLALLIFILRVLLIYLSTKIATKISGENKEVQDNLWLGFIPQTGLIGVSLVLALVSLELREIVFPIVLSVATINFLIGPALLKLSIENYKRLLNRVQIKEEKKFEEKVREEIIPYKKFNIPQFEDPSLNELVISLREKLISHLKEFENVLINKRSEESLEFYYQIVEKYIDEYQQLKNIFTKGIVTGKEIKKKVLLIQQEISEWFAQVSINRKAIEQQILNAEYLLQKLFDDLKEYCENAPDYVVVAQEQDKYEKEIDDSLFVQSVKSYKRFDKRLRNFLGIKSILHRKIPYVTLVKYYFEYQIALEMEKVAFLLGLERLNVLRKVKRIYDDVTTNLEELLNLVAEHKDVEIVSLLAIDKLNEIHDRLKQEISSIGEEIEASNKNISTRLNYAFANPFNQFLKSILKAGTIELNIKKFHFSKIYSETNKAKETTLETIRFWVNYLIGFLGVCERDARIFEITGKINSILNDTLISHFDTITDHIKGLISELNSQFKSFEKDISEKDFLKFENLTRIKNILIAYRDNIIQILNEKGVGKLTILKKTYSITNLVNSLKDQFSMIIKNYDKEIKVLDERDFELKESRTKYIELKTLHFTDIIKNYFENEILQEIIRINEIVNGHISSAILELKNFENVIYYHFNIAIDELNNLETNADTNKLDTEILNIIEDTLKSSIKLIREKIKIWDRQVEKFESEIEVSLTEKIYSQITNIKEAFRKELISEIEKRVSLSKFQIVLKSFLELLKSLKVRLRKRISSFKHKVNLILRPLLREKKEFLEFDLEGKSIIIYLYDQTVYDERVYNSLPYVYKKLFDYKSSDIVEILVGREKEKELLNQAYQRTLRGLSGSTAIIGESGTGKSSLISSFISKLQTDANIYRYNFEKTIRSEKEFLKILSEMFGIEHISSYEEIISELNIDPKYKIIILEDVHKIYLRKFGGLEAMKKLLLIISETSNKIFWIVSISYHAWQLLNRILNISNYFPFQIKTEILTKEQIKEAILKRHQTSGYNLEFLPDDESKIQKYINHSLFSQDKQATLEEKFFNQLYDACEGNITSALFYWIKSIKEFRNDTVFIKPLKKLDFHFLETFEIDKLLTLSNLIQHGSLTITEHQEIFKCDEEKSKTILNFLNAANLVHFDMNEKGEKVFYVNPAVYKPVEIELRKLHIFD